LNGFLDGNLRKQLGDKVSIMLIFNSEINQLPPSITRPGRLHAQIHVGKINKDKGLVVLKSLAEEEKVVDIKAELHYRKILLALLLVQQISVEILNSLVGYLNPPKSE